MTTVTDAVLDLLTVLTALFRLV